MRKWSLELPVDRGVYRIDLRSKTYRYVGRNQVPLPVEENARNKRQLHGLRRVRRDGTTTVFIDPSWPYSETDPCPTYHSWVPRDSPCDHDKYECPTCGRRQCLLHWAYPMRTRREAIHFLKAAETVTGKPWFVRAVDKQRRERKATVWKIFTSEYDFESYRDTGQHAR